MTRSLSTLAWLAIVLVFSTLSRAAPSPSEQQRATELFKQGRAAMTEKDYTTACARFAESQRLLPARGTLLNLAVCLEARGELVAALEAFEEVLVDLPERDERNTFARQQADALRERVPQLVLEPSPELPREAKVARDGVELTRDELGAPVRLDPGEHLVEVRLVGHESRRFPVRLQEGDRKTVILKAGAREAPPDDLAPAPSGDGLPPLVVGGIAATAVGVVAIAIGGVTGGLAMDRKSVVDRDCGPALCSSQEGVDAAADGATFAGVSTATFIIGGSALATGVLLVLLGLEAEPGEAAVVPAVGPGGVGLVGRF